MNTKLVIKTIFALLLFIVIFLAGFYVSAAYQMVKSMSIPHIESETNARNRIRSKFNIDLPENATHLYYAGRGFVDADHYAAFSLSNTEECETFIEKQLDVKLEDFKEITELPDDFTEYGPDNWEQEYHDPAWNLLKANKYLLCTNSYAARTIIYVPDIHRFYFSFQ